uniref:Transmembrane protein n=1 Tax=Ralstonia solanacearum TaxID=305 RepID=A0A0S4U495_RALSL|nr:exported protein of unknown function [Ralstonia solanacearum]
MDKKSLLITASIIAVATVICAVGSSIGVSSDVLWLVAGGAAVALALYVSGASPSRWHQPRGLPLPSGDICKGIFF